MTIKVGYTGFVHSVPTSFIACTVVDVKELEQQLVVELETGDTVTVSRELFKPLYMHKTGETA